MIVLKINGKTNGVKCLIPKMILKFSLKKKLAKNKAKKIVRFPNQKDAKGNILKGKPDLTKPRINLKIPFKYVGNKIVGYDIKIYDENVKDEQGKLIPVYPNDNGQTPDQLITKGNIQATFETKVYVMDGKLEFNVVWCNVNCWVEIRWILLLKI